MFCATDTLQQSGDGARGTELADELDRTNIDAQLQGSRGNKRLQFPALQSIFRIETQLCRKTSMVRRHCVRPKQFAEMMCHALGHAARIHEH